MDNISKELCPPEVSLPKQLAPKLWRENSPLIIFLLRPWSLSAMNQPYGLGQYVPNLHPTPPRILLDLLKKRRQAAIIHFLRNRLRVNLAWSVKQIKDKGKCITLYKLC